MITSLFSKATILAFTLLIVIMGCQSSKHALNGGRITKSINYKGGLWHVNTDSLAGNPFLVISDDNIEIDFNQAVIDGRKEGSTPDQFTGIAIHIHDCRNITLKNVNIRGFKIAILAEHVENLKILSSNLSYNYRPKLRSRWDREALSDWLYFHQNEKDEWKDYGAAIYLKQCYNTLIKDVICHQGMNGILMTQCEGGLMYNNDICFNSGLGIGLYRSAHNRIMHNKLDWNARGYSHGKYERGQDSSAILLYEQSSHNTIAYNSGTHSGDGLFLWAGQHTMDTGLGGCDSNIIYRNDFSHSIANGIEVTFSANYMSENILNDCRYGVWGGYSHHSLITGNEIKHCETGIAIEHGRYNVIDNNVVANGQTGVHLWARVSQPSDWPYPNKVNTTSRQYLLANNKFENLHTAIEATLTDSVWSDENTFTDVEMHTIPLNGFSPLLPEMNKASWMEMKIDFPPALLDGISTTLSPETLRGKKYIIINEWGPYDFKYPLLALREKKLIDGKEALHFDVLGPKGLWRIDSILGCSLPDHQSGVVPDSFVVLCNTEQETRYIGLAFSGDRVISQFGDTIAAGHDYPFHFEETTVALNWKIDFFAYDSLSDPLQHPDAFTTLLHGTPLKSIINPSLVYRWWNAPDAAIPADKFAVRASSTTHMSPGEYSLVVESDDGIRIWLDNKMILERWDIHTPMIDEIKVSLTEGLHELQVEYFEGGGLGVLDVSILKSVRKLH